MKKTILPEKLKTGDKIMVVAPSDSFKLATQEIRRIAKKRFSELGLEVYFAKNVNELNEFDSSSIQSRVEDIHEAFENNEIRGVFAAFGGYNCNELLDYIDWNLIQDNPKVFVGFSDITALQNAMYAKTGLVTYSGPLYSRFGQKKYFDYTLEYFKKCAFQEKEYLIEASLSWSDDWWKKDQESRNLLKNTGWALINNGSASGTILGGNLCTLNLLQGTEYFPDISNSVLFIEDDSESKMANFIRDLQALIHLPNFKKVRGIVIGRFQKASEVKIDHLKKILKSKAELATVPILANVDFGHTDPIVTFPIGGRVELTVSDSHSSIKILEH